MGAMGVIVDEDVVMHSEGTIDLPSRHFDGLGRFIANHESYFFICLYYRATWSFE